MVLNVLFFHFKKKTRKTLCFLITFKKALIITDVLIVMINLSNRSKNFASSSLICNLGHLIVSGEEEIQNHLTITVYECPEGLNVNTL